MRDRPPPAVVPVSIEDGYGVLSTGFDEFVKALAGLDVETGLKVNDTLVRKAAEKLVNYFHKYAEDLATLKKNKEDGMRQDIKQIGRASGRERV